MKRMTSQHMYVILCACFITALIIADIIGSKLIVVGPMDIPLDWIPFVGLSAAHINPLILSAGIIPFPLTFVLTDLINEFYGKESARFITFLGLGMAIFAVTLLYVTRIIPAADNSPIPFEAFNTVFGLSGRMFLASLTAYLIGQVLDIQVFHFLRHMTHEKMLWLRATGSTVVSQLVDSLLVTFIAFSGKLPVGQITEVAVNNYGIKFLIAVALTPLLYLGHSVIYRLIETRRVSSFIEEPVFSEPTDVELTS